MLRVDHARWDQTPADLRELALSASHPRTRERFLALYEITQESCATRVAAQARRHPQTAKVTTARVLGPHHDAGLRRLAAHPVVLCVQDTTELDYTGKQTAGLGPLNYAATCISMSPRH